MSLRPRLDSYVLPDGSSYLAPRGGMSSYIGDKSRILVNIPPNTYKSVSLFPREFSNKPKLSYQLKAENGHFSQSEIPTQKVGQLKWVKSGFMRPAAKQYLLPNSVLNQRNNVMSDGYPSNPRMITAAPQEKADEVKAKIGSLEAAAQNFRLQAEKMKGMSNPILMKKYEQLNALADQKLKEASDMAKQAFPQQVQQAENEKLISGINNLISKFTPENMAKMFNEMKNEADLEDKQMAVDSEIIDSAKKERQKELQSFRESRVKNIEENKMEISQDEPQVLRITLEPSQKSEEEIMKSVESNKKAKRLREQLRSTPKKDEAKRSEIIGQLYQLGQKEVKNTTYKSPLLIEAAKALERNLNPKVMEKFVESQKNERTDDLRNLNSSSTVKYLLMDNDFMKLLKKNLSKNEVMVVKEIADESKSITEWERRVSVDSRISDGATEFISSIDFSKYDSKEEPPEIDLTSRIGQLRQRDANQFKTISEEFLKSTGIKATTKRKMTIMEGLEKSPDQTKRLLIAAIKTSSEKKKYVDQNALFQVLEQNIIAANSIAKFIDFSEPMDQMSPEKRGLIRSKDDADITPESGGRGGKRRGIYITPEKISYDQVVDYLKNAFEKSGKQYDEDLPWDFMAQDFLKKPDQSWEALDSYAKYQIEYQALTPKKKDKSVSPVLGRSVISPNKLPNLKPIAKDLEDVEFEQVKLNMDKLMLYFNKFDKNLDNMKPGQRTNFTKQLLLHELMQVAYNKNKNVDFNDVVKAFKFFIVQYEDPNDPKNLKVSIDDIVDFAQKYYGNSEQLVKKEASPKSGSGGLLGQFLGWK